VLSAALAFGGRPLVYAPLVLLATMAYSILFTPALALIADGADDAGLAQGLAFGMMNAAWAAGATIGPVVAGALAGATADAVVFALSAAVCAGALAAANSRSAGAPAQRAEAEARG
jgi:MFS family permease